MRARPDTTRLSRVNDAAIVSLEPFPREGEEQVNPSSRTGERLICPAMVDREHLLRLTFPCPTCEYNVVAQALAGIRQCPECGGEIPDVAKNRQPVNRDCDYSLRCRGVVLKIWF